MVFENKIFNEPMKFYACIYVYVYSLSVYIQRHTHTPSHTYRDGHTHKHRILHKTKLNLLLMVRESHAGQVEPG